MSARFARWLSINEHGCPLERPFLLGSQLEPWNAYRTTRGYKTWLQDIQPANATHQYASFLTKGVAEFFDGVWAIGKVSAYQGMLHSMTRNVPSHSILPNKISLFRLFGQIPSMTCLVCRLIWTTLRANATKQTQRDPRRPAEALVGLLLSGAAAPSSLPSSSSLPQSSLFASNVPAAAPAQIFCGHSLSVISSTANEVRFF
jgi:hypothetical protein